MKCSLRGFKGGSEDTHEGMPSSRCLTNTPQQSPGQGFKLHIPTGILNPGYTLLSRVSQASLASFLTGTVHAGGGSPIPLQGLSLCQASPASKCGAHQAHPQQAVLLPTGSSSRDDAKWTVVIP